MRPRRKLAAGAALLLLGAIDMDAAAANPLNAANSAELQQLLAAQAGKKAVHFSEHSLPSKPKTTYQRVFAWNEVALDTTAIDNTPVPPGGTYSYGQQIGPARSARAMAIVHIAMFEAANAVFQKYQSYAHVPPASGAVSVDCAIAQAAHDALLYLYPSQAARLDPILAADIATMSGTAAELGAGRALGRLAAESIIVMRSHDGAQVPEPQVGVNYFPKLGAGYWSPDPVSHLTVALGAFWTLVQPFVIASASQFRPPPPPALDSIAYTQAYKQVVALGGDPAHGTPTQRTSRETQQGIFWTYDGVPDICAPPRLYNQIARTLAFQEGLGNAEEAARYLAVINTAMADAALAAWDGKYFYQFWRPVTAIRYSGNQGNPALKPDPYFYPLGAQATNAHGPNFTPPFPAYPSGHAAIGGAVFEVLRSYWKDATPFTFVSDEFNGKNYSDTGQLMPLEPVHFSSISEADYNNAESRVWIGVHWQFDADAGRAVGRAVADWVLAHAFLPVRQ
jgi:membrane-associated phospholipid phosphatase